MGHAPWPDGLGAALPEGLTAPALVRLIAPGKNASLATLVGAKAWPHRDNTYIAIACLAASKADGDAARKYSREGQPSCEAASGGASACPERPIEVHLAMIEWQGKGSPPKLIASYGKPLDVTIRWKHSQLTAPQCADENPALQPATYERFDFAPFQIAPNEMAFGIRAGWFEGYAGGGGTFQGLMLFAVQGQRLVNILSEPISYHRDLAGSWNKDGTRNRSERWGENIVAFLPGTTDGHYDLQIKGRQDRKNWQQLFVWNASEGRYQAKNPKPRDQPSNKP